MTTEDENEDERLIRWWTLRFGRPPCLLDLIMLREAVASVELSHDPEVQTHPVEERESSD